MPCSFFIVTSQFDPKLCYRFLDYNQKAITPSTSLAVHKKIKFLTHEFLHTLQPSMLGDNN